MISNSIPGYKTIREIGQGGMAVVYQAIQESLDRHVALKVMSPMLAAADPSYGNRFLKEGRTVAQLRHPGIVQVYDIGASDDSYYMAMEYLSGGDLAERIKHGMSESEALDVLRQLAEALAYAHGKGYVHRDIKPENVLFDEDGRTVLTDFGIARTMRSGTRITRVGMTIGTPQYMSPEQARAKGPVDGRSDLYSLGVLFHEMLTGQVPFDAEDTYAIGLMHISDPLPVLPTSRAPYQPLLERLMAKEPADRFADAGELLAVLSLEPSSYPQLPPIRRPELDTRRNNTVIVPAPVRTPAPNSGSGGLLWGLGGAILALIITGILFIAYLGMKPMRTLEGSSASHARGGVDVLPVPESVRSTDIVSPEIGKADMPVTENELEPMEVLFEEDSGNPLAVIQDDVTGSLSITSEPEGAHISIDGRILLQKTPVTLTDLHVGEYIVHVYHDGYQEVKESVRVTHNHIELVNIVLSRNIEGVLSVNVTPRNAKIKIMEIKPPFEQGMRLAPGSYTIVASADGYFSQNVTVAIVQDQKSEMTIELQRKFWADPLTGMEFVWVSAGCFQMGCGPWASDCRDDEHPKRRVCLDGFWMGKYEVTQGQWVKIMNDNPSHFKKGDEYPVEQVSWHNAQEFIRLLNERSPATGFRLPTEAEWEYAARSEGKSERFSGGNDVDKVAWHLGNSRGSTHPVGKRASNRIGIYDMSGNVREWVEDVYQEEAYRRPFSESPSIVSGGIFRVQRGGAWDDMVQDLRTVARGHDVPGAEYPSFGFRLVRYP